MSALALVHLEERLKNYLREKLKLNRFSLKCQNKQLAKIGDIGVKTLEPQEFTEEVAEIQHITVESTQWILPISRVQLTNARLSLFLNRERAYHSWIVENTKQNTVTSGSTEQSILLTCDADKINFENLTVTDFRVLSVINVVRNLLLHEGFSVTSEDSTDGPAQRINVGRAKEANCINLLCGVVTTNGVSASEYIRQRANDMQLIAQHKYGIRIKDHQRSQITSASLGRSAAIVDILESKPSSPIDLSRHKNPSSKGAAFILYNYARLSVLFESFTEKQTTNYYPELPPVEKVNFNLLKEEDEWHLFWVYLVGFAAMRKQALGDGQLARLAPHVVLSFASGLVICLSKYYRRVRILTENREHLLPTMFARIYLLRSVFRVLSTLLQLLELEPITQM